MAEFSEREAQTLLALLDVIIPPSSDGKMPGAGELGFVGEVSKVVIETPGMRAPVAAGLAALNAGAIGLGVDDFSKLPLSDRFALVDEVDSDHPEMMPLLVYHTYLRYYQQGRTLEGLGVPNRAPFPEGYSLEEGDLGLLDPVREMAPRYRS